MIPIGLNDFQMDLIIHGSRGGTNKCVLTGRLPGSVGSLVDYYVVISCPVIPTYVSLDPSM